MDDTSTFENSTLRYRPDLDIRRNRLDGAFRYVLRDANSHRLYALSIREYHIFSKFDGGSTCSEIFESLVKSQALHLDEWASFKNFISELIERGLLVSTDSQIPQKPRTHHGSFVENLVGPPMKLLFWKKSLGSPNELLTRLTPIFGRLFTWQAAVATAFGLVAAIFLTVLRWDHNVQSVTGLLFEQNILLLLVFFCLIKFWHELGHGIACRAFGCSVHDWGLLFIAGTPCAYVDASATWSLTSRRNRIIISLAGIYFECILAIPAVAVWAFSETAWLKAASFQIIILSTATTVLFNANPLMKFDGYFALCDLLDLPNLRDRSKNVVYWVVKRILALTTTTAPEKGLARILLFAFFGAATSIYGLVVVSGIFVVLTYRIPTIGLVIALLYGIGISLKSFYSLTSYLLTSREVSEFRVRAILTGLAVLGLTVILLIYPVPREICLEGYLGYEREIVLRATAAGILTSKNVTVGDQLNEDQTIATLHDPLAQDTLRQSNASMRELELLRRASAGRDRTRTLELSTEFDVLTAKNTVARHGKQSLEIKAPDSGTLIKWEPNIHIGADVNDGEAVATLGTGPIVLKAACNPRQLREFRPDVGEQVLVSFPWNWKETYTGTIVRVSYCTADTLESAVISQLAGGSIEVNPVTMRPIESVTMIEVQIDSPPQDAQRAGIRGEIRLLDRKSSLANWAYYRWLSFYRGFMREQA